jgi:WD40 repeat protein
MARYETAIVRLRRWAPGRPTAGLGVLIGPGQVVTCAHVVNTALGREKREQALPGEQDVVLVDFPLLPGGTVREARVVAWVPPPLDRSGGADVAGLTLAEDAPAGAALARFRSAVPEPGTWLRVFGYPGSPPRATGVHVEVELKGEVGGQLLQVESRSHQTVKAQPGFSGSPVWDHASGEVAGLLQAAPFSEEPERDAYLLSPLLVAHAWEAAFDYLLAPENPYRGLEPFTTRDAGLFFGRDSDIAELTERVGRQPVVLVVGPSGVGKSSLLQAGLIPALEREQQWSVAVVRLGQDPWIRLATGLLRVQHDTKGDITLDQCQREVDRLRVEGLGTVARFWRGQGRPFLVVVDQFEELLTGDAEPDLALLDLLLPPVSVTEDALRLVLALRADFLPILQSIPGIHSRLNDRLYLLSPLTGEQMHDAVECPAAAGGVSFERGLADQILHEATGSALPVLQFALTRLWETQRHKTLTFAGYHALGGVRGALDRFSQERASQLGDTAAELVDRVLLRLVRIPIGSPDLATRERVLESRIPAAEWQVLQRLAGAWLVTLGTDPADGESYAELAHEALITAWQHLNDIVIQNAEFLSWLAWIQLRAADGDPLPEDRIAEARQWLDTRGVDIPAAVTKFVQRSETAAETRLRELREARDRARTAQERAEAAQAEASSAACRAEALRLAADAELALRTARPQQATSLALAMESLLTMPTVQGELALRHVLRVYPATRVRLDHEAVVNAVAFSPDGTRVATGSYDDSARVFDTVTGTELARLNHDGDVNAVAFSPDGTRVATASDDRSARVFDAATGTELARLNHDGDVNAVAFSPDGTQVATGSDDRSARVFDAATGTELARLDHDGTVNVVAFSPDGTRVATGSYDDSARVFDAATGTELARLDHGGATRAVAFSPDGTRVATASDDRSARVFDAATGTELARLDHDGDVNVVAFSPDGTQVATGSDDRSARVFDAATGTELARLDHDGAARAVAFSPDGTRVATGSYDDSARVFDAATGTELARLNHDGVVRAVAFSPDGTRVATGSYDRSARVFDAATGTELARLDHDGTVNVVAFSPDGTRVATGSYDDSARVFDAATGTELARLDHDGDVNAVAFSPDGTQVATGSDDRSARVFEAARDQLISRALSVMTRPLSAGELRRYSLATDCPHIKLWDNR